MREQYTELSCDAGRFCYGEEPEKALRVEKYLLSQEKLPSCFIAMLYLKMQPCRILIQAFSMKFFPRFPDERMPRLGINDFAQRLQDKSPLMHPRMGNDQRRRLDHLVPAEEEIEIDGAGTILERFLFPECSLD